jgi:hypothetical protein
MTNPPFFIADWQCASPIPGIGRMARGVDAAYLDLLPLNIMTDDDGFRAPIINYTCSLGRKIKLDGVSKQ